MPFDSYFYSLKLKYNVDILKSEITECILSKFNKNPNYGGFYRKESHNDVFDGSFRYAKITYDDLKTLKYTNYLKCLIEDELNITFDNNIPITVTEPNTATPDLHKDRGPLGGYNFAVNVPLFKQDIGCTEFWEITNEDELYYGQLESKDAIIIATSRNSKNAKKIIELKMDGVKILNTSKYHSVNNLKNNNYRMNLSFRMPIHKQLTWDEILKRAKEVTWE